MTLQKFTLLLCLFLGFGSFLSAQTRNCGTMEHLEYLEEQDPDLPARMQEIERHTHDHLNSGSRIAGIITIPVVVHVVWNTAAQNLSDAQIMSQIDVLNEDFRRMNADAANTPGDFTGVASDVEIEFCLATVDPSGNPTTGITRTQTSTTSFPHDSNEDMKFTANGGKDAWPAGDYLNLWVCNLQGTLLGYAQFPGGAAATDGVVIDYEFMGRGGSASPPFDLGRTATHEVGHWLNLRHIWGDGDCSVDDLVADTPNADGPNFTGAPCTYPGPNSCIDAVGDLPDMFQNYMDYSDDGCMNLFTNGQSSRMRALFDPGGFRESLLSSNGCNSCTAPVAMCTPVTVQLDANGNGATNASTVGAGSTADCGLASETVMPSSFDCNDVGPNTVTYTNTDINGASSTCTTVVTVEDNIEPSISCPSGTMFPNDPGVCEATFTVPTPTTTDNCGVIELRYRWREVDALGNNITPSWSGWSTAVMQTLPVGRWKIQWQAKDASGQQNECEFIIDIIDNEAPMAVCLNNTVYLDPTGNYTLQDVDVLDFILSSDNCVNFNVIDIDPAAVDCDDDGTTVPVLVTIEDDAGLTDVCTAMISVEQGTALPAPWTANDVGGSNGSAIFQPCDGLGGTFTVDAMGFSLPNSDKQEFVAQQLCGQNNEVILRVANVTGGGWAGIQMREDLAPGSKKVVLKTQLTPIVRRDVRQSTNGFAQSLNIPRPFQDQYLRLVRQGSFFIGYTSVNGINWQFSFYAYVPMSNCIYVGMYVESINVNANTTAMFDNVSVNGVPVNPLAAPATTLDIAVTPELERTEEVHVYPNPTTGEAFTDMLPLLGKQATIKVYNSSGQVMQMIEIEEVDMATQRLDIGAYQNGLYLIQIETPDQPVITRRLVLVGER